jgi:hypothetical protein
MIRIICIMCCIEFVGEYGDSYCETCWYWMNKGKVI